MSTNPSELEGFQQQIDNSINYVGIPGWIPFEFIQTKQIKTRILLTDRLNSILVCRSDWSWIVMPQTSADWTCLATCIKHASPQILLCIDMMVVPASFITFLNTVVSHTTIILYSQVDTVTPSTMFFSMNDADRDTSIEMIQRFFPSMSTRNDITKIFNELELRQMGLVVSYTVETDEWTMYWYQPEDSLTESEIEVQKNGAKYLLDVVNQYIDKQI